MRNTRAYTNKIIDYVDQGLVDPAYLYVQLLNWLSEAEVKDFYEHEFSDWENEEEE